MNKREVLLDVMGMSCPSCVRHVNAALADLEGMLGVEVRLRDGKVRVQYDAERLELSTVIEALREQGFESAPSVAA